MKKLTAFIFTAFSFLFFSAAVSAEGVVFTVNGDFPMLFSTNSPISPVSASHGVYAAESYEDIEYLIKRGVVESVEEDFTYTLFDTYTPADKYYPSQTTLSLINAQYAWNKGVFGSGVKVAVIDSGLMTNSADFTSGGVHRVMDCFNSNPSSLNYCTDTEGHGTSVTGIIAASHNIFGIAGIAPSCEIYVFRCFATNEDGKTQGKNTDIIRAIYSAVDDYGCDIINMSFGDASYSTAFENAANYAHSKGAILVASAGNDGAKSSVCYYPASYDNVISVGSSNANGHRASHSQRNELVTIMAPGENVFVQTLSGYSAGEGTSFAAPQISAAAALVKSYCPSLSNSEITELIYSSADAMPDAYSGHGQLNIAALLQTAFAYTEASLSPNTLVTLSDSDYVCYSVVPEEGLTAFLASYDTDMLKGVSRAVFGRLSAADFASSRLFLWEEGSLSPRSEEIKEEYYTED